MNIKTCINNFKQTAITNCQNSQFVYHEFFVKDHLLVVEKIAIELCDIYKDADRNLVMALVWFHDLGKPIDMDNEYEITLNKGVQTMKDCGFSDAFILKVVEAWKRMEMKNEIDLSKESIEVQIVSSADGASHFVGKFFSTYFRDNSKEAIGDIETRLKKKIEQDWKNKIILPEVKEAFKERYKRALEIVGEYPKKLIV
ncbi:MAG: HD domain-containing protein [Candidatus Falkowbacteria bacterium]